MNQLVKIFRKSLNIGFGLILCSASVQAGNQTIYNQPMSNGSGVLAKPNLMYLMDNSGSMAWGYLPDSNVENAGCAPAGYNCVYNTYSNNFDLGTATNLIGLPPGLSSSYNFMYYNPNAYYPVPVFYDPVNGRVSFPKANPSAAYVEPYTSVAQANSISASNISSYAASNGVMNLTTNFPNFKFCDKYYGSPCITNDDNSGSNKTSGFFADGVTTAASSGWEPTINYPTVYNGGAYYYAMTGAPVYCSSAANLSGGSTTGPCSTKRDLNVYKRPYWGQVNQPDSPVKPASTTLGVSRINGSGTFNIVYPSVSGVVTATVYSTMKLQGTLNYSLRAPATVAGTINATWPNTPSTSAQTFSFSNSNSAVTGASGASNSDSVWGYSVRVSSGRLVMSFYPKSGSNLYNLNLNNATLSGVGVSLDSTSLLYLTTPTISCPVSGFFNNSNPCTATWSRKSTTGKRVATISAGGIKASASVNGVAFTGTVTMTGNATTDASALANAVANGVDAPMSGMASGGVVAFVYNNGGSGPAAPSYTINVTTQSNASTSSAGSALSINSLNEAAVQNKTATISTGILNLTGNASADAVTLASNATSNDSNVQLNASGATLTASLVSGNSATPMYFSGMNAGTNSNGTTATGSVSSASSVISITSEATTTVSGSYSTSTNFTNNASVDAQSLANNVTVPAGFSYTVNGATGTFTYPNQSSISVTAVGSNGGSASSVGGVVTFAVNEAANSNVQMGMTITIKQGVTVVGGPWVVSTPVVNAVINSKDNRQALANAMVSVINGSGGFTAVTGNVCSGSSTTNCTATVIVTAPSSGANVMQNSWVVSYSNLSAQGTPSFSPSSSNFAGYTDAISALNSNAPTFQKVRIVSGNAPFVRSSARTDCNSTNADGSKNCTYNEEIQNFANWFSYYRTRIMSMKGSVSVAFDPISNTTPNSGWRVGLMFSNIVSSSSIVDTFNGSELPANDFNGSQKASFYKKFMSTDANDSTPLRELTSRAGWYFAGKMLDQNGDSSDPVQYSCQLNAVFLSTDGYWNGTGGFRLSSSSLADMPDQDGSGSPYNNMTPFFDTTSTGNTLSDVAMYYHDTDLRTPALGNCTGALGAGVDVCANNAPADSSGGRHQKIQFYALSFGMGGTLNYADNYLSGGSSDYNAILNGTKPWPSVTADSMTAIDDLWHATVNGRGQFFNTNNPSAVAGAFATAISQLGSIVGSASSAATSSLEPVSGDNFAYVASFRTLKWDGDLQAQTIDLSSGVLSNTSVWSAQNGLDQLMSMGSGSTYPTASAAGRLLYTFDSTATGTDKKMNLDWATISGNSTISGYFNPALVPSCGGASLPFCVGETKQTLFEYLMGQTSTSGNFRDRSHVLGDVVYSQPVYVKKSPTSYSEASDPGYSTFKAQQSSRVGAVYVGANDGFLHSFSAVDGSENWAYAPSGVLPNMYALADKGYSHQSYVDGYISVGDIQADRAVPGSWKTLLVAGLGNGGSNGSKGVDQYVGIDVTDPSNPQVLWEYTDSSLGKTFGNPLITKVCVNVGCSGNAYKWAVIIPTGYNSSGAGSLIVIDAATGSKMYSIATASSAGSGLNKINNWVDSPTTDNTTLLVYGGDDDGNLWRFDLSSRTSSKMAEVGEPISTIPQLALISNQKVVIFGTGRYITLADASDTSSRGLYAIKDQGASVVLSNPQASLVKNTLVTINNGSQRKVATPSGLVNWATQPGWYIPLPDSGERLNIDPKLQLGVFYAATNVPSSSSTDACVFGGYSWLNQIDIKTGQAVNNPSSNPNLLVSQKIGTSLAVGVTVVKLPSGKLEALVTTSDNQHPSMDANSAPGSSAPKRVSWRDLSAQ